MMQIQLGSAVLVATALVRNWTRRPVRMLAAVAGGAGGVMLTAAVLMIAVPVVMSTKIPPIDFLSPDVVAVAADAPAGVAEPIASRLARDSGAHRASGVTTASTTALTGGTYSPVVVYGIGPGLPDMLSPEARASTTTIASLTPGNAVLSKDWAQRHGLAEGDDVSVNTPQGTATWQITKLLDADFANRGAAIVVPITVADAAFDRGGAVDIVLLRGPDRADIAAQAATLVDGAASVTAPDHIFASYDRIFRTPLMLVGIFAVIAIMTGAVIVFLTWRLTLNEARPTLAQLRLLGCRSADLLAGSAMLLVPVVVITYLAGAVSGVLVGRSMSAFRNQIMNFTGQALEQQLNYAIPLAGAFAAAVVMFGLAWLTGLWQLRRVSPIDAISGRSEVAIEASSVRWPLVGGISCFAAAAVLVAATSGFAEIAAGVLLCAGLALLSAVVPTLAGKAIRNATSGPTGLLVGRQLEVDWRRNAALTIAFALALLTSITISGMAGSLRRDIDDSVQRLAQGQLYVLAAPVGSNFSGETFNPAVRQQIARVPGVASTDTFAFSNVAIDGGRYRVQSMGGDTAQFIAWRLAGGPPDSAHHPPGPAELLIGDDVAISSNFARTQHLQVGSMLEIPIATGHRQARIVAIVDDSSSDGGMIATSESLYRQIAGSSGVYSIGVVLAPGADESTVRAQLAATVAQQHPRAQVVTSLEYRNGVGANLGRLMSSFTAMAWIMFLVATVVSTAIMASNLTERSRGVSLIRLVGGRRTPLRRLMGIEALITVAIAWLLAVPAGLVATSAVIGVQSVASGLLPSIAVPWPMVLISLPLAIAGAMAALFIARRSVADRPLSELLMDD